MYNILDGPYSLGSWVRGGTVFPKGIRSAGPKIGPDRIPYDTGSPHLFIYLFYRYPLFSIIPAQNITESNMMEVGKMDSDLEKAESKLLTPRKFTWKELSKLNSRHNAHVAVRGKVR